MTNADALAKPEVVSYLEKKNPISLLGTRVQRLNFTASKFSELLDIGKQLNVMHYRVVLDILTQQLCFGDPRRDRIVLDAMHFIN